jgi:hypothetical protein
VRTSDASFIVMLRFDYDAAGDRRPATAALKALEDVTLRGADKPTRWWWSFLFLVSAGYLVLWVVIAREVHGLSDSYVAQQLLLSGVFAVACAFRSILPRVDLEQQCLWNSPLSSIFVGRSVATVAELCFAGQCALLISKLSSLTRNASLQTVAWSIVPLILIAQVCCWYAVVSLNHLGHAIEQILWVDVGIPDGTQPGIDLGTDASGQQDLELARHGGVRGRCPADAGSGRSDVFRALTAGEELRRRLPLDNRRAEGRAPAPTGRAPLVRLAARGPMDEPLLHRGRVDSSAAPPAITGREPRRSMTAPTAGRIRAAVR